MFSSNISNKQYYEYHYSSYIISSIISCITGCFLRQGDRSVSRTPYPVNNTFSYASQSLTLWLNLLTLGKVEAGFTLLSRNRSLPTDARRLVFLSVLIMFVSLYRQPAAEKHWHSLHLLSHVSSATLDHLTVWRVMGLLYPYNQYRRLTGHWPRLQVQWRSLHITSLWVSELWNKIGYVG